MGPVVCRLVIKLGWIMKCFLAVLLFVGAALSNSTHRYAWQPQNEYSYRYETRIEFSIPQIRGDRKSGLKLASVIRVQAQNDYSLLIQLTQPRFLTLNGLDGEEIEEPIPPAFGTHLETPFKVHFERCLRSYFCQTVLKFLTNKLWTNLPLTNLTSLFVNKACTVIVKPSTTSIPWPNMKPWKLKNNWKLLKKPEI